ncbi:unnamed protein product, partial [Discosporangium mesarthrocarpum]
QQQRQDAASPVPSVENRRFTTPTSTRGLNLDESVGSKLDELAGAISSSLIQRLEPHVEKVALHVNSGLTGDEALRQLSPSPHSTPSGDLKMVLRKIEALENQLQVLQTTTEEKAAALSVRIDRLQAQCIVEPAGWGESGVTVGRAVSLLSQRTGTMEGRHKIVQSKVAQLDNALGLKAADWGQTLSGILMERAQAGHAAATSGRSERGTRGSGKTKMGRTG